MKILFAGTPRNAALTLEGLVNAGHEVVAVLTRPDAEVSRKRILTESAVAETARNLGLETIKATRITTEVLEQIAATKAQLAVVVAYGTLLDRQALDSLEMGWINLHYSLLPDWRGAAPVQHAILAGDRETGVTLFKLDEGMDTGDVIGAVEVQINPRENAAELLTRLTEIGITLLNQELPKIAAGIATFHKQTELTAHAKQPRLARKLQREDARINWQAAAIAIEHQIRALNPEPMAFTALAGETFRILDAVALGKTDWESLDTEAGESKPGCIQFEKKRVLVRAGGGTLLELKTVQPAGKKPMSAIDWARGAANSGTVNFFD